MVRIQDDWQRRIAAEMLEALDFGLAVVSDNRAVLTANSEARKLGLTQSIPASIFVALQSRRDEQEEVRLTLNSKPISMKMRPLDNRCGEHLIVLREQPSDGMPPFSKLLQLFGLTRREYSVCCLLCQGVSNVEIARLLSISNWTVKKHVAHVLEKVGARGRWALPEAIRILSGWAQ